MPSQDSGKSMLNVQNGRLRFEEANNRIVVSDSDGNDIVMVGERADGVTGVVIMDTSGNDIVSIGKQADGKANITVTNSVGADILKIGERGSGKVGLTVTDSSGNDILLIGEREDGSIGIDLAQSGHDVKTASLQNMIWSSLANSFKIVGQGNFNITLPEITGNGSSGAFGTDYGTITHDLGYPPAFLVYIFDPAVNLYRMVSSGVYETFMVDLSPTAITGIHRKEFFFSSNDTTFFYLGNTIIEGPTTAGDFGASYDFKYYLLAETAS